MWNMSYYYYYCIPNLVAWYCNKLRRLSVAVQCAFIELRIFCFLVFLSIASIDGVALICLFFLSFLVIWRTAGQRERERHTKVTDPQKIKMKNKQTKQKSMNDNEHLQRTGKKKSHFICQTRSMTLRWRFVCSLTLCWINFIGNITVIRFYIAWYI